jgi:hypothetical protein
VHAPLRTRPSGPRLRRVTAKAALRFVAVLAAGALAALAIGVLGSSAAGQTVTESTSTGGVSITKTTSTVPVEQQAAASAEITIQPVEQSADNGDGSDVPWWVWAALILLFGGIACALFWGRDRDSLPASAAR